MSPKSPAIQVALSRAFRASTSVANWLMFVSCELGTTGNAADGAARSTARASVSHPRLRVHAEAVEDPVDEVEVADALDGIDECLVRVPDPAQGVEVRSGHAARILR